MINHLLDFRKRKIEELTIEANKLLADGRQLRVEFLGLTYQILQIEGEYQTLVDELPEHSTLEWLEGFVFALNAISSFQ